MFLHLLSHVVTHEAMQQSGRVKVTGPVFGSPRLKRAALVFFRLLTALMCAALLGCWLAVWGAEAPRYTSTAAAVSVAACALAAFNLLWALSGSPCLKRLGWLSSLAQFAAGMVLLALLGTEAAGGPRLYRIGVAVVPIFEMFVTGLFLYDRQTGGKIPVDQSPE